MSGRPPTPPNDEEMEDAAWPVGAGAGPAPAAAAAPNVDNQRSDVKSFIKDISKKIDNIPYEGTRQSIKNAVQELINNQEIKDFVPEPYDRFKTNIEKLFTNNDITDKDFADEVEFETGRLKNLLVTAAYNKDLGLDIMELMEIRAPRRRRGGKRKTRRNKKTLRKKTNGRKTAKR